MEKTKAKSRALARRHRRVRGKVSGTRTCPRLCVTRTNSNVYAQLVDDDAGVTLVSASTIDKELRGDLRNAADVAAARRVGEALGRRATEMGINEAVFDRGGRLYHGQVKSLADGARDAGLRF